MSLDMQIHHGAVASLGQRSFSETHVIYDSMTLEGGKRIGKFATTAALDQKLAEAVRDGESVELHMFAKPHRGEHGGLLAIGRPGGVLYASEIPALPAITRTLLFLAFVFGVVTIPFFGAGFLVLYAWWRVRGLVSIPAELRAYVLALKGARLLPSS
jgi:hypothetical protein